MEDKRLPELNVGRLVSLDVLRGVTVAGMILVTDPGTYDAVYPQLLHAQWQGATAADMIFPGFLVMIGVAITLSLGRRLAAGDGVSGAWRRVLRRSVIILLLGLLVNGFPEYHWSTLRLPGVFQRIAICYLCAASFYLLLTRHSEKSSTPSVKRMALAAGLTAAGLLLAYTSLLRFVPVPGFGVGRLDSLGSLPAFLDRAAFGTRHLWAYGTTAGAGVTYDPEGLLSTVPALAAVLFGVCAGEMLQVPQPLAGKTWRIATLGAVLLAAGLLMAPVLPFIKKIYTASFCCFSTGIALLAFSILLYLIDVRQLRRGSLVFRVFGTNAMLAFLVSGTLTQLLDLFHIGKLSAHHWLHRELFAGWLGARNSSLAYAFAIVALNFLLLYPLYRRGRFLRV